jgi:hypothetical protein
MAKQEWSFFVHPFKRTRTHIDFLDPRPRAPRQTKSEAYLYNLDVQIKVITKLPNSEQSYKGKVKTHNYINRQNQSTKRFYSDGEYSLVHTIDTFINITCICIISIYFQSYKSISFLTIH